MEGNSFWLIYIQDTQVSVSLVSSADNIYRVLSVGPQKSWDLNDNTSLITSVDESLSIASLNANITEDQEPSAAAFVVPPFWISNDGKILPSKVKFIKDICKELSLTPSGFLAEDDALVEESNQSDGFPSSFILLHLSEHEFYLSLVYLGHIKERIKKQFDGEFTGQILESTLVELNSESTLPPQIIIFGQANNFILNSLKNFPWIGKKNVETFLHLPDIKLYSDNDIVGIFTKVISAQLNHPQKLSTEPQLQPQPDINSEEITIDTENEDKLSEVSPQDLGFSSPVLPIINTNNLSPIIDPIPEPNPDLPLPNLKKKRKINFSFNFLKKVKFHRLNFNFLWIILIILPFAFFIPFFFIKSEITIFVTPYQFDKSVPVTLKIGASPDDFSQSIIPVQKESFDVEAKVIVETTGQKTIGEKAKGEVIIYNKVDKVQNIPKGAIVTDSTGKKFELTTAVSIAASSSNLDQGIITLGQTKTVVIAVDIGSEFNLATDSQLKFKDFPDTSLIAKTTATFSGGSRQQIRAVSQEDKVAVQAKIDEEISKNIDTKITQTLGSVSGIIKETIQSKKDNLELSREVGEAADELTGTVNASVTVFILSSETKNQLLSYFLSSESDFNNIDFNPDNFSVSFKISKTETSQATGTLVISGKSLPKIDILKVQKSLTAKTIKQANEVIKKMIPRAYNFHINTNFPLLPFRAENINFEIKTESL